MATKKFIQLVNEVVSEERLKGVPGPERLLVGPAAQRVERQDGVEDLREDSGVEPDVEQSLCPECNGGAGQLSSCGLMEDCWACEGTGQRSGRLNV